MRVVGLGAISRLMGVGRVNLLGFRGVWDLVEDGTLHSISIISSRLFGKSEVRNGLPR